MLTFLRKSYTYIRHACFFLTTYHILQKYFSPDRHIEISTGYIARCNSLLYSLPTIHKKLQRVQNAATRLICNAPRHDRITPILHDQNWLPV